MRTALTRSRASDWHDGVGLWTRRPLVVVVRRVLLPLLKEVLRLNRRDQDEGNELEHVCETCHGY